MYLTYTNHDTFNCFSCILIYRKKFVHLQGKFSSFSSFLLGYLFKHKEGLFSNTSQFFFLILRMVHKSRPWYSALSLSYLSVFCFTNMHVSPTSFRLYFISNFTNPIIYSFMDENFREEC